MAAKKPKRPDYSPVWTEEDTLTPFIDEEIGRIDLSNLEGSMDRYRAEAMRTGPSAWARLAEQAQLQEALQARDRAAGLARGTEAAARSSLAMRGGLSSGARERVARDSARNVMAMDQDVSRSLAANKLQIGMNDEANRLAMLGQLPGMEAEALKPGMLLAEARLKGRQFDLQNRLAERDRVNAWEMDVYREQGKHYAADRGARATEKAAEESCFFLCTKLRALGHISRKQFSEMAKLLLWAFTRRADFGYWYLKNQAEIIRLVNESGRPWKGLVPQVIEETIRLKKEQGNEAALQHYIDTVFRLCAELNGPLMPDHILYGGPRIKSLPYIVLGWFQFEQVRAWGRAWLKQFVRQVRRA